MEESGARQDVELAIDELDDVSGGLTLDIGSAKQKYWNLSCPQCGSDKIIGLYEGTHFKNYSYMKSYLDKHMLRCTNCRYTHWGSLFTLDRA